jgi:putative acetyltransferase
MTTIGLRPYLPSDGPACVKLFRESVEVLTEDDYDDEQRSAWSAQAENAAVMLAKLADALTLVATVGGLLAGFASLKGDEITDLYVSPDHSRLGVASSLLDALLRLERARGAQKVTTRASETARPLFAKFGFVSEQRNLVSLGDTWLANTTMSLVLRQAAVGSQTPH